jgi:SHS2 domain-containing protein
MAGSGAAGTAVPRGHRILPHTADAGIAAEGPTLEALFEEAAAAIAELSADVDRAAPTQAGEGPGAAGSGPAEAPGSGPAEAPGSGPATGGGSEPGAIVRRSVELSAPDLVGLAFAWLNECIGLVDVVGAIVGCRVFAVDARPDGARLRASVDLVPFDGVRVRRRADVKSATYHGLAVEPVAGGWTLTAYLDL